jgi:hypothetical protein
MATQPDTIQTGRRLAGDPDPVGVQVFAVERLATQLTRAFAAMLLISLVIAAFVGQLPALVCALLAAAAGAGWGDRGFRRRSHPNAERFPPVPDSAVVAPSGTIVLVHVMRVLFMAAAPAVIIASAGHGATVPLVTGACVPPLLSARMLTDALMTRRGAIRYAAMHHAALVQTAAAATRPPRLYGLEADRSAA